MVQLNRDHPEFNMAMEVLCSIPPGPGGVCPDLLCEDLGISRVELKRYLDDLYLRKVAFRVVTDNDGRLKYRRDQKLAVDVACNTYWGRVNLGKDCTSYSVDRATLMAGNREAGKSA